MFYILIEIFYSTKTYFGINLKVEIQEFYFKWEVN